MAQYYSPLRYPGGKNCIFPFMVRFLEMNHMVGCSYAEPFAGGAGLALHLLLEGFVDKIYINDYDRAIYAFWHAVINETDRLCQWIRDVEVSMRTWEWAKQVYTQRREDIFELAKATFFLNRTNVSGIITGGPIGGNEQLGKYKIDARFKKVDLIDRIEKIAQYKKRIEISNLEGMDFLRKINRKHNDVFVYLDPPYVKKGAELYMNYFIREDHIALRNAVAKLRKKWLISYDNQDIIKELYSIYESVLYRLSQCASNRTDTEILICSHLLRFEDSINYLKNPKRLC
ncbi:DNA adenine methylase [uncultured Muribaculum sp.]|uniref:DNA adenine methylase n=1 Tax=uncultured Muribaculum sp. TaxID=1918613 RepID=UPI0025CF412D|nr:DNA adenine methylase [uncultured Muribaculum sp.]